MIAIFDARAEEFGTLGLGILEPTSCTTSESDGGLWEISLEQPVTDDMRWALIQQMRIIRAPAPVRESPCVEIGTTTVERRIYKTAVPTKQKLYLRNGPSLDAKRISLHAYGAEVQVLREANEDWSEVITLKGGEHGYMWTRYLEYVRTETETIQADTPSKIIETYQTRDQLFRISSVESDSAERMIRVKGEHITYDLRGVVVAQEYNPENEPANVAVQRLMEYADHETDFTIYCGSSTAITGKYTGRNIIDCLFNPDDGIVKQAGLRVIRDNFEIYLLPEQEREVQAEIRYGHNMLSAALTTDTSDVITRIFPYGTDSKGNEVRGAYVDSPHIDEFPVIMAKAIEYDIKDIKPADAAAKLQELAEAEFGIIRLSKLNDWCENLIKTWTDHQSETDAIVNQYITSFNDNTNPVIQALQTKFGDSSDEDVATIRQYQTDVSALLWRRQNGYFTSAEKTWLRNMVVEIDAMSATCDDVGGTSSGLDAASVKLDTDFVRLELSPAYTAVANQYALHMYDVVPVIDEEIGLVAAARMTGYEFDCIMQQYTSTDLGDLEDVSKVYGYELATGSVQGTKLISGTIGGSKLQDATIGYAKINAAAITQLTADSVTAIRATIRELVAQQITTDQLYADLATIAVAQITTANIDNANINWAQIQNLTAEIATVATAEIQSAKISYANVYDLSADTALIRQGAAGDFFFDKLSVSSAQMVDLTVGQLTVKASNGNYYSLDVDLDTGNVTANQVTVTQAEIDAGKTSTGNHIIDTDLTVTELSTSTAKATEALINKLTAQRIDVAELFAQQAFIAALDANMIKASNIQALEGQLNVWANDKIQLAVDNVQVGGRNLITDSETIYLEASTSHFAHKDLYSPLTNGQQYTITFGSVVQTAGSAPAYLTLNGYCFADSNDFRAANVQISNERKSYTFAVPDDGRAYTLILYHGVAGSAVAGNAFTLNKVKLEIGNKATDWTPAPEDTDAAITATRSMITQTATEIRAEVSDISIGGRNLLPGTRDFSGATVASVATMDGTYHDCYVMHYNFTASGSPSYSDMIRYNGIEFDGGGTYMISFWCKGSGSFTLQTATAYMVGTRTSSQGVTGGGNFGEITINVPTDWTRIWVKWQINGGTWTDKSILFRQITNASNLYVAGVKLERGDKATDWTPAPEDVSVPLSGMDNLYSTGDSVSGYLTAAGGVAIGTAENTDTTSDYIAVTPGETLTFQCWVTPLMGTAHYLWMGYGFFDSNKTWMASPGRTAQNQGANTGTFQYRYITFTVPAGAAYIRISGRMYADGRMKLERNAEPTPYRDAAGEVANTSMTLNKNGFYVKTSGTVQIDADDPAKKARIALGTLMSLDYTGGLQAIDGSFANSLKVNGKRVWTAAEITAPIKVATSQPSGHGFLWVKPTSVTSASYSAYSAGSRDSTVHFGATNPITRSFTADTTATLANATFTYTLDFDVYCLTDLSQVTNVKFTAVATKGSASVSFGASAAMTMTKYTLAHVTLTATSSTNLFTNSNAISVAITASASSLNKLFIQSDQYMTLKGSNQSGTGTQTCSVYYVN